MTSILEQSLADQYVITDDRYDWAFKEAPSSYVSTCVNNWNRGNQGGPSMDALETASGIRILETGIYFASYRQRTIGTVNAYGGISLNGDRYNLDIPDNIGAWDHDHSYDMDVFTISTYLGPLTAGDLLGAGASSTGSRDSMQYGISGHYGTLFVLRIK